MLRIFTIGVVLLGGLVQASFAMGAGAPTVPGKPHIVRHYYRPGEILVKYRSESRLEGLDTLSRQLGAASSRPLRKVSIEKVLPVDRWRHVTLPRGVEVGEALAHFRADPNVEHAEPNYLYTLSALPNDPQFMNQWSLRNTGLEGGVRDADISAIPAWDAQRGNPSVVIAIVDTGVDTAHPDIAANIWRNPGEVAGNGTDDDGNGYVDDVHGYDFFNDDATPADDHGHGTHVAGIAAAVGNNRAGISGVAWSASVMALKAFGADGRGDAVSAIDAILYASRMGARILNNSWGGYSYSQALYDTVAAVNDAGGLFVAGAGNDNSNNDVTPFYPASYDLPNVIAVAASNRRDARASFSNYGRNRVHLGAPGDNILSLKPGNQYVYRSGTSMATPHVTGSAALLLSQDASLETGGLRALLLDRAEQIPAMVGITGTGARLDVYRALACDPSVTVLAVRAPTAGFAVLEAQPTALRVQITNCGHAVTGYSVTANFSNGDGVLTLHDDGQHGDGGAGDNVFGNYWLPQNIGDVTVSISAAHDSGPALDRSVGGKVRARVRYQHASVPYAWIDTQAGQGHALDNDGSVTVPIGFAFDFYGIPRSEVTINANGLLSFGSSLPAAANSRLPNPRLPNDLIAPLWDDLLVSAENPVRVLMHGQEPHRRLTIAWLQVARRGIPGLASFQATLHEGSNEIVFSYQDVDFGDGRYDNGAGAVVGVEDPDGLDATVFSSRQRLVKNSTARRFYPVPTEPELSYRVTIEVDPSIRSGSGELAMMVVNGDGTNNNFFSILQFANDGDMILEPRLTGDASGSFIPGPAHIGDASFVNEILQASVFGNRVSFLMRVSRNGMFQPYPDAYAFYLLDDSGQPYRTSDPFGTDSLFSIEIDRTQPVPQVFQSAYATATVETVGAPVANAGGPYVGVRNQPLTFDGSASFDPEGQSIFFNWDFGDGAVGTGATPAHAYEAPGTYRATLVVDDVSLYSAPSTALVTIGSSQPPAANAGPDQTVDQQVPVTLTGSGADADGTIVAYTWRQTAGPAVALSGSNTASASFTSPLVIAQSTLSFELTARDNTGDVGRDAVNVVVRKNNLPPVANAGPDQNTDEGARVVLGIHDSTDPDGDSLGIEWLQIGGPVAPLTAEPGGGVSFTVPDSPADARLIFRLTVTDNQGASDTDSVDVLVRNINDPRADAGPDQVVDEHALVQLSGAGSSDPDGGVASYAWQQTSGIFVSLNGASSAQPSFTAPGVDENVVCGFKLTVTDNAGRTAMDTVDVTVRNVNAPPVANAGPDKSANEGSVVSLNGNGSDPDGSIAAYQWQQIAGPTVSLTAASTANASFTAPPVAADTLLSFQLTVTDNSGATETDTANITVLNFNQIPSANAGPDQAVFEGAAVALNGGASSDADGTITQYRWTESYSDIVLSGADTAAPSFIAPSVSRASQRVIQLEVTDDMGLTAIDSVVVTIQDLESDGDGDGLGDGWEIRYFGSTGQGATDDPDADGLSNLQEYQSGADPTVADSVPGRVSQVSATAGDTDAVIAFGKSPAATRYDLYWSTSPSVSKATGTRIANVTSPYLHSGRSNSTTYYYVVVAGNLHGDSPESAPVSVKPGPRAWGNAPATAVTYAGHSTNVVADGSGRPQIIYYRERVPDGPLDIYSVKYGASGWGQPVLVASTPYWQNEYYTNLHAAMNRRGDTVVVWTQDDGVRSNLWSSFQAAGSGTWEAPRLLETDVDSVRSAAVSIGDEGLIAAAWIQGDNGGGYGAYASIRHLGSGWSARQRLDQPVGGTSDYVSVAAGRDSALVAWTRALSGVNTVQAAHHVSGGWQTSVTLLDNGPATLGRPEVGIDATGNGLVVYPRADARGRHDVRASRFTVSSGWQGTGTTIDSATGGVLNVRLAVRADGRAVAAWNQGSSLYGNLMNGAGTWSGVKTLTKTAAHPRGLVTDSLGRGLAIWSVNENGVFNTYSSIVSSAGWAPKLLVENAVESTYGDGLVVDEYGSATAVWREGSQNRANGFQVGNAGLGGGSGGGGPRPKGTRVRRR